VIFVIFRLLFFPTLDSKMDRQQQRQLYLEHLTKVVTPTSTDIKTLQGGN
jgi:hypothetical protein